MVEYVGQGEKTGVNRSKKGGRQWKSIPPISQTPSGRSLPPLIPPGKAGGRPRAVAMRAVLNAIFSLLRAGCAWRMLPREYPPRSTVYGYDGAKKLSGRKRHLFVDTMGLLLKVVVPIASLQDREGVKLLLEPIKGIFPRMKKVWVDSAYTGKGREWIEQQMGWEAEVVRHPWRPRGMWVWPGMEITEEMLAVIPRPKGFRHLPRRWVVERTLAWIGRNRRMSKEFEYLPSSSERMVQLTMIRVMLKRLARATDSARETAQRLRAA